LEGKKRGIDLEEEENLAPKGGRGSLQGGERNEFRVAKLRNDQGKGKRKYFQDGMGGKVCERKL